MIAALILVPALAGLCALWIRDARLRRGLLVGTAALHTAMTARACWARPSAMLAGWLELDALGLLFLGLTSVLFLAASVYAVDYLRRGGHDDEEEVENLFFSNEPEAVFIGCLLFFLSMMTLVTVSQHFGMLWVAIEATTLCSAPLIYFHRQPRSLEATWKYLMICSVGIALALMGNFFLAVAASGREGEPVLLVRWLVAHGAQLHMPMLKTAFIFLLVGYGTKMGLAPLHTWLPDAHSEAPSLVSALLSGALLNCAFVGILRAVMVCHAGGLSGFCSDLLVMFGLVSMAVAAVFILGQTDFKRLLAYSSVEHMGILALGVGIGGGAAFGAMLHAVNHSLTKGLLFLASGNILAAYRTKSVAGVQGLVRVCPATGILWIAGFLAIAGFPPFGVFVSEFTIARWAFGLRQPVAGVAFLALLALVFVGLSRPMLAMAQGDPPQGWVPPAQRDTVASVIPPALLAVTVLILGVYVPAPLMNLLQSAAQLVGGTP